MVEEKNIFRLVLGRDLSKKPGISLYNPKSETRKEKSKSKSKDKYKPMVGVSTNKEKIHVVSQNPNLISTIHAGQSQRTPNQAYQPQQY